MGYHQLKIHKHSIDSPYKVLEEFLEYIDAIATGNKIMAIQELSDLYGTLENEISKYGLSIEDLKIMSDVTKKVFKEGTRPAFNLYQNLLENHDSIQSYGLGFIQIKCGDINYNFYHKDIPTFKSYKSPHSHQQDFVSEVISGSLIETLYDVTNGSQKAFCGCGDSKISLALKPSFKETLIHKESDIYLRLKEQYHSVKGDHGTITKVTKYGNKIDAYVIHPDGKEKYKSLPKAKLWLMVKNICELKGIL